MQLEKTKYLKAIDLNIAGKQWITKEKIGVEFKGIENQKMYCSDRDISIENGLK